MLQCTISSPIDPSALLYNQATSPISFSLSAARVTEQFGGVLFHVLVVEWLEYNLTLMWTCTGLWGCADVNDLVLQICSDLCFYANRGENYKFTCCQFLLSTIYCLQDLISPNSGYDD